MKALEITQLDSSKIEKTTQALQQLLADFQVYYTNLRGYHWNIKGHAFYTLHAKFEQMYTDAAEKVDEIAERLLMLDVTPANKFSNYLKIAKIAEVDGVSQAEQIVKNILGDLKYLIALERQIIEHAEQANDEATVALMSDYLREQEKEVWMLTSTLS